MSNIGKAPASPLASVRERPSRRIRQRLQLPLTVTIEGCEHIACNWSAGGFGLIDASRHWRPGTLVQAQLRFPLQDSHWGFAFLAQVRHADPNGHTGFRFVDLQPGQIAALESLVRASIVGEVVTLDHVLTAVAQATPPSAVHPEPPTRSRRRFLGYAALFAAGLALMAAMALSIHSRFLVVHASHVAASVPVVRVSTPIAGTLRDLTLRPGSPVRKGQPLFSFADEALQAEIDLAEEQLGSLATRIDRLRHRQSKLDSFFGDYTRLAQAELQRRQASVADAEERLRLAQRELARMQSLEASGHVAEARIDQALQKQSQAHQGLLMAKAELDKALVNLNMARNGRYYTGSRVEDGEPATLAQAIADVTAAHALQSRKLVALRDRRAGLVVTSPCDCVVARLLARDGEWVNAGTKVYLLRPRHTMPALLAKVPQAQARLLNVGGTAAVRLPDSNESVIGTIAAVSRLPPAEARLGLPVAIDDDPALATVEIRLDPRVAETLAAGTPAQAAFPIDIKTALFGWLP